MREKREMCGLQPTYKCQQPVGPDSFPLHCRPPTQLVVNDDDDDDDEMMNDEANFGSSIRMKLLYVIGGALT